MPLVNCKMCGRAFNSLSGKPICNECREKEESEFLRVREFVKDNPKVAISVVSEKTGVSAEKIRRFLNEGLLEQAQLQDSDLQCQLCKASIPSGNYCINCMTKLRKKSSSSKGDSKASKEKQSFILNYQDKKK